MHKGVILLVAADSTSDAIDRVQDFMTRHEGSVYDYFSIGGRWSTKLNSQVFQFKKKLKAYFNAQKKATGLPIPNWYDDKVIKEHATVFNDIWTGMGGKGEHPFIGKDLTRFTVTAERLSKVKSIVKSWYKDMEKEAANFWKEMLAAKAVEDQYRIDNPTATYISTTSAYYAGLYKECRYDSFSFESNVFSIDAETHKVGNILKHPKGIFAVMIDMHN